MSHAPLPLAGRTAVITGAGSGIGRALALKAAAEGMTAALCDVSAEGLAQTVRQAQALGAVVTSSVIDVRDAEALRAFAAGTPGEVALVFANAGLLRAGPVASQSPADLQLMFEVNVLGVIHTAQAFLPRLKAQAAPSRLVITGSQASFVAFPNLGGYSATKHALLALAETLSAELAAEAPNVGVCLLAPGAVATAIFGDRASPNAAHSLTPDQAAAIAFEGARRGDFLISTHADLGERMTVRYETLKGGLS